MAKSEELATTEVPKRPRRRRAPVSKEEPTVATSVEAPASRVRKAPTSFSSQTVTPKPVFSKKIAIVTGAVVVGIALSAWLGFSDRGQIDVGARVAERNAKIQSGEVVNESGGATQFIPVQTSDPAIPNAGLRGQGVGSAHRSQVSSTNEVAGVSTSTATTSESIMATTASTTDTEIDETSEAEPIESNENLPVEASDTTSEVGRGL